MILNDKQIKHMATRFLAWRLPEDFNPDAGISYKPEKSRQTQNGRMWQPGPTGTNLLNATQAEQMVLYMTEGLPKYNSRRKLPLLSVLFAEVENAIGYYASELTHEEIKSVVELVCEYYDRGWQDAMNQENVEAKEAEK